MYLSVSWYFISPNVSHYHSEGLYRERWNLPGISNGGSLLQDLAVQEETAKSVRSGCWSYLEIAIAVSGSHRRGYKKVGSPNQELGPVWLVLDPLRGYRVADVGMAGHHPRALLSGWFWSCQENLVAEAPLSSVIRAMLMVIGKTHHFSSLSSSQSPCQVAIGRTFQEIMDQGNVGSVVPTPYLPQASQSI